MSLDGGEVGCLSRLCQHHVKALECGGADASSNMQWQTTAAAKAKDKTERIAVDRALACAQRFVINSNHEAQGGSILRDQFGDEMSVWVCDRTQEITPIFMQCRCACVSYTKLFRSFSL